MNLNAGLAKQIEKDSEAVWGKVKGQGWLKGRGLGWQLQLTLQSKCPQR